MPPEHISEEEYNNVKNCKEQYPDYYVGYVGFHATFAARYFQGYARAYKNDGITLRNPSNEAYRNTMKQIPYIKDIIFTCGDYKDNEYSDIKDALIYCDPPYVNTTRYEVKSFDYNSFWDWCRDRNKYNFVFISSYDAPSDFKCIWQKEILANFDYNRGADKQKKLRVEKLFVLDD